jgi:hypothetical protein
VVSGVASAVGSDDVSLDFPYAFAKGNPRVCKYHPLGLLRVIVGWISSIVVLFALVFVFSTYETQFFTPSYQL